MQVEVINKHGRARPYRRGDRLEDGERLRVPHTFMDAATRDALRQKYGWCDHQLPQGGRRGYHFDVASPARNVQDAAAEAYEAKRAYLQNAWRKNHQDAADDDALLPTRDARADADQAYRDKCERLQNAWRLK
jgi:hypothetical protein